MIELNERHESIMLHALGANQPNMRMGWRNYYVVGDDCHDWDICEELVAAGFMTCSRRKCSVRGGMDVFHVTEKGKEALV